MKKLRHCYPVYRSTEIHYQMIPLQDVYSFHFYRWNQFKVIPLACTHRTRNLAQKFFLGGRDITAYYNVITMTV